MFDPEAGIILRVAQHPVEGCHVLETTGRWVAKGRGLWQSRGGSPEWSGMPGLTAGCIT